MLDTISATGRQTIHQFKASRAFNIVIATDPASSTVKLQYSTDGSTWYDYYQDGSLVTYTARDFDYVRSLGAFQWAINCTTYGGTPFVAGLVGE